ncbi:hypothetical protein KM043_013234 [Ampulex compressa]|nr:hypothetical protein KM043_013234 [Ampulex compressa]
MRMEGKAGRKGEEERNELKLVTIWRSPVFIIVPDAQIHGQVDARSEKGEGVASSARDKIEVLGNDEGLRFYYQEAFETFKVVALRKIDDVARISVNL